MENFSDLITLQQKMRDDTVEMLLGADVASLVEEYLSGPRGFKEWKKNIKGTNMIINGMRVTVHNHDPTYMNSCLPPTWYASEEKSKLYSWAKTL